MDLGADKFGPNAPIWGQSLKAARFILPCTDQMFCCYCTERISSGERRLNLLLLLLALG